jgi:lysophospholipase L1-like esterase
LENFDVSTLDVLVVGDSIVGKMRGKLKGKQVEVMSLSGQSLDGIVCGVLENAKRLKSRGCLIVQGGGNGLLDVGLEGSKCIILSLLDEIKKRFPEINVAVVPLIPRNAGDTYDETRKELNKIIRPEIFRREMNTIEMGEGSYWERYLSADGVHLNYKGIAAMVRECNRWIGVMSEGYYYGGNNL